MESWDPRQVKSCLLTPHHHHLWPQEMPFKNLHRRRSGLTPKTKGILSHSNTNTTTYACTLTHSQPYMHAYTHTNRHNSSKSFEPFFFPQSTTKFPMDEKRAHNWNLVLSGTNFTSKRTTVKWWVWLWGFGGGGSSSIPNKFLFCCCCSVLVMDLRLMLGVRQSVTGTYTKLIFKHILTTVWTVQCSHFYGNYTYDGLKTPWKVSRRLVNQDEQ